MEANVVESHQTMIGGALQHLLDGAEHDDDECMMGWKEETELYKRDKEAGL